MATWTEGSRIAELVHGDSSQGSGLPTHQQQRTHEAAANNRALMCSYCAPSTGLCLGCGGEHAHSEPVGPGAVGRVPAGLRPGGGENTFCPSPLA